jgi:tRNA-specific adenosine deaminase 3
MPVNPLSAETISNLPPPLHSNPTSSPNTPPDLGAAVLTPDILWRECDWYIDGMELDPKHRPAYTHDKGKWGEVHRIKGPAELEEYGEDNGTSECRFAGDACLFS